MKMANDLCDEDYKQYDSLSPHGELARGSLKITINDKQLTTITLRHQRISEVVMWMIRQKQNLDAYMAEWEDVLKKSSKKTKSNRVSLLAIKALDGFLHVEQHLHLVITLEEFKVMAPCQLVRQCLTFWIHQVPEIQKI